MASKAENEPSLQYAIGTFVALLVIPLFTFGVASYASLIGDGQATWGTLAIAYAIGTIPGLTLGIRYLKSKKSKITFGIAYVLTCLGLLFVEGLIVACNVTGTCL